MRLALAPRHNFASKTFQKYSGIFRKNIQINLNGSMLTLCKAINKATELVKLMRAGAVAINIAFYMLLNLLQNFQTIIK